MALPLCKKRTLNWQDYFTSDEDGDTPLMMAIVLGDERGALYIVDLAVKHGQVNLLDAQNKVFRQTALHLAMMCQMSYLVQALICAGVDLELRDREGNTVLHLASSRCPYSNVFQHIIKKYGVVRCRSLAALTNYEGKDCLHLAVLAHSAVLVDYLLYVLGMDPNSRELKNGMTVLHEAVKNRDLIMVVHLARHTKECDINAETWDGHTALRLAVGLNDNLMGKVLISAGANEKSMYEDEEEEIEREKELMTEQEMIDDFQLSDFL